MLVKLNPLGAAIDTAGLGGVFTAVSTSLSNNLSQSAPTVNIHPTNRLLAL